LLFLWLSFRIGKPVAILKWGFWEMGESIGGTQSCDALSGMIKSKKPASDQVPISRGEEFLRIAMTGGQYRSVLLS
jgi:hypothetical protein